MKKINKMGERKKDVPKGLIILLKSNWHFCNKILTIHYLRPLRVLKSNRKYVAFSLKGVKVCDVVWGGALM